MEEKFITTEEYLESDDFQKYDEEIKQLVKVLLKKINDSGRMSFKISERNRNDFLIIPDAIINAGKAYKGMMYKNVSTITCMKTKNIISIEIEPDDSNEYNDIQMINDELITRIIQRYDRLLEKHKIVNKVT